MNPITELLISKVNRMTAQTDVEVSAKLGLSRAGLKKALDPDKLIGSWLVGTLLKLTHNLRVTIVIYAGSVNTFNWTIPIRRKANPITPLLIQLIPARKKSEIARQLGFSRRTLYDCLRLDKQVESFKLGTLLNITKLFPITIIMSKGLISAHEEEI